MVKSALDVELKFRDSEKLSECEICAHEKQTCKPFPKAAKDHICDLFEIVHTDVYGPMRHATFTGNKYFVTFLDDKLRWCVVYFVKRKSDVLDVFNADKAEA